MTTSQVSRWRFFPILVTVVTMAAGLPGQAYAQRDGFGVFLHFKCYTITPGTAVNEPVRLFDQFHGLAPTPSVDGEVPEGGESVVVRSPSLVCSPVFLKCRTNVDGAIDRQTCEVTDGRPNGLIDGRLLVGNHLKCYHITPSGPPVNRDVVLFDQFHPPLLDGPGATDTIPEGGERVSVRTARYLCTPAIKCLVDDTGSCELPLPEPLSQP